MSASGQGPEQSQEHAALAKQRRMILRRLLPLIAGISLFSVLQLLPFSLPNKNLVLLEQHKPFRDEIQLEMGDSTDLTWHLGDFSFRGKLAVPPFGRFSMLVRCSSQRPGLDDFTRLDFLGPDQVEVPKPAPGTGRGDCVIHMPDSERHALHVRGRGRQIDVFLDGEHKTSIETRFAFGYSILSGEGSIQDAELIPEGPIRGPYQLLALPIASGFTLALYVLLLCRRRRRVLFMLALPACLAMSLVTVEAWFRASPQLSSSYDMHRFGFSAEALAAFGPFRPDRALDLAAGRLSDEYAVHRAKPKKRLRVALFGTSFASQDEVLPAQRWYVQMGHGLSQLVGKDVELILAIQPGALPSASLAALLPWFRQADIDLLVILIDDGDLMVWPDWRTLPSSKGWSTVLLMNAMGLAEGESQRAWRDETKAWQLAKQGLESSSGMSVFDLSRGGKEAAMKPKQRPDTEWASRVLMPRIAERLNR